jgi:glycosyltransferase involved in cell wall biosynthesis
MTRTVPTRVLHVLAGFQRGGLEYRLLDLVRSVDREVFVTDFCCTSGTAGPLGAAVRALGSEVFPLPLDARFPVRFARLVRAGQYDAVHSHVYLSSGFILALAAVAGVRGRIAHFRSTSDGRAPSAYRAVWRETMRCMLDRYASHIVGVCEGALDSVWTRSWRTDARCHVIYNGLDPERLAPSRARAVVRSELGLDDSPVFLHVGRARKPKNHARLLSIFGEMVRADPAVRLLLVGGGTAEADGEVAGRIRALGLDRQVLALGERDDVPDLLNAADAMLLPSLWEGLPGVVLEACAAGLPVLATDLPGVREIASKLPLVRSLPLSASDAEWASLALVLPEHATACSISTGASRRIARSGAARLETGIDGRADTAGIRRADMV